MTYDKNSGFVITGVDRYPSLLEPLKLIYPAFQQTVVQQNIEKSVLAAKTIFSDYAEDGITKWGATGATVDNTRAFEGANSFKLNKPPASAFASLFRRFPIPKSKKIGLSCFFALDDTVNDQFLLDLQVSKAPNIITEYILRKSSLLIEYLDAAGNYQPLQVLPLEFNTGSTTDSGWIFFKMVVDTALDAYVSFQVNEWSYERSVAANRAAGAVDLGCYLNLELDAPVPADYNAWVDQILVTEE